MAAVGRKPEQIPDETKLRLAEVRQQALESSGAYLDSETRDKSPLDVVAILAGHDDLTKRLDDAVIEARNSDASWGAIAEALGDAEPGASRRTKNRFHKRLADRL